MITVELFKKHFYRDFPYLPEWDENKAYFEGETVFVYPNFYKSMMDGNTHNPENLGWWELTKDSTENYLCDEDIEKAIAEANMSLNKDLFDDNETDDYIGDRNLAMLYLTAYYLVIDIKNSSTGISSNAYGQFVASKSVGSVSESYGIPAWVQDNPVYAMYMTNGYGMKYLSFVIPRLTGFFYLAKGGTTID
jgi:hypothetical protein